MSRQSAKGRHQHCSSSSTGSASYQGISGATSPVYHLPQEPYHPIEYTSFRKKRETDDNLLRDHHNYYNIQKNCFPKESIADTHSYQYLTEREDRKSNHLENNFSDDSSYYDYQRNFDRDHKFTNNLYSEYESDFPIAHQQVINKNPFKKQGLNYQNNHNIQHNVLLNPPNQESNIVRGLDRVYPEAPLTRQITDDFIQNSLQRTANLARISRGNSPDSAVGSAIVDGCGGHCVGFETVCSYVLKVFFVMGILIGVSLCIAGTVLRRTKSRDLQVLVYIGALSAMVSTLLLVVQCRVRRSLRKRKRAVRMARTATIPMGDIRPVQQPLISLQNEDRGLQMPLNVNIQMPQRQEIIAEQQGVPWWRRNDLPSNRV